MVSRRWLHVLVAAVAVDVALALAVSGEELQDFLAGHRTWATSVAGVGLAWQVVVLVAVVGVERSLLDARRDLHRRNQALAAAAATSPDWLWETDPQLRLTYSSPGVREMLGYEPGDLLGLGLPELLVEPQLVPSALPPEGWDMVERVWRRADGGTAVLVGSAVPIRGPRGELIGYRGSRRLAPENDSARPHHEAARQRVEAVLSSGGLQIAWQPIVDLASGRLAGVEALARFGDGRAPDLWFRDAADAGLLVELDRLAFRRALQTRPQLPAGCYLSVNTTPQLLLSGQLGELMPDGRCDWLVVEITEHSPISDYDEVRAALAPLRRAGVRLAIDDTGAGYASLLHVLQLEPAVIKLDRSLVSNVQADPARRSLLTAMVLLALELDAALAGEGVESAEELQTLTSLGVELGQGYLLGRPSSDPAQWHSWATRHWDQPSAGEVSRPSGARRQARP